MNFKIIPIQNANNTELLRISQNGLLSLNLIEMQAIQSHFAELGRDPTDVEIETLAQTWSEHCVHKTFRGLIEYTENEKQPITINGLLKTTIVQVTEELNKSWCVSVFEDNAGIIEFDNEHNIVFKVETHNHPSAIEPYGGAGTGIGGVIRDSLGTGLGAKPILNTNVFCFGLPSLDYNQLPKGTLHPKRVFKGVVSGVRDYGNRMGIPTANGAILFDYRYTGNPLVYCGNVGIIPADRCQKKVELGDAIVVIGGKTGRDGIHGATFSSLELDDSSENLGSVVQIGNPIVEKKITDVLIQARDLNLYNCITDCGAGGLSSAIGEMGSDSGAEVYLDDVSLKYEGLAPWEIWLSEAQERMVISIPLHNLDPFLEICQAESVEVTVLGKFTGTKQLQIHYHDQIVADLSMDFLHHGIPRITKQAVWKKPIHPNPNFERSKDLTGILHNILACPNVASKEWVIRQYDHEVQGGMVIKPLVGIENDGPSDACVTLPVLGSKKGVVIANGINPLFGDIDPYHMAASAIDEAIRNVISVGGRFDRVALLDNFSWGNPDKPDRLGGLVRAAQACYDIALAYSTPFISGKDSLYNEYHDTSTGDQLAIPGTLLISAISVIDDVDKAITMDAKSPGNLIYVIGKTYNEIGGSHYTAIHNFVGNSVPVVRPETGKRIIQSLNHAIDQRLIRSCHDCSEGGIGVACAEMAFAGGFGMNLDLSNVPRSNQTNADELILFSESNSRFIAEISPQNQKEFEHALIGVPFNVIGQVTEGKEFIINGMTTGEKIVDTTTDQLKASWQGTFNW